MSKFDVQDVRKIVVTSSDKYEDFNNLCTGVYLISDTDCYINFNYPATTGSFLVKANQFYHMEKLGFNTLHVIGTSGNLYICATRATR